MNNMDIQYSSVDACYGHDPYRQADFTSLADLISHLDRLGVSRSLVWRKEAATLHPTWGNRELLADLDSPMNSEGRLQPAFVIIPSMLFEKGSMEFLCESMASGRVRAIQLLPKLCRYPIYQIQPILDRIRTYKPILIWNVTEQFLPNDAAEMDNLARLYPELSIICVQFMWSNFPAILNLMLKNRNVMADISWVHFRGGIDIMVRNFGAERVVFGLGPKLNYGAAIAALAQADLSVEQRNMIAFKNLDRLLGLKGGGGTVSAKGESRPLWEDLIAKRPITSCRILDAHTHLGPMARGWVMPEVEIDDMFSAHMEQMNRIGIARSLVMSEEALFGNPVRGNMELQRIIAPHRGRFGGMFVYNARQSALLEPLMQQLLPDGYFVGFKTLFSYWNTPPDDPGFRPMWKYADEHCLPVLAHTWDDLDGMESILKTYPDMIFIAGHSGGGVKGRQQVVRLAKEFKNIYLEWCGTFMCTIPWADTMREVGCDRVVFGSDTLPHDVAWELGRLLSQPIPEAELVQMLGENLGKILARRKKI